LLTDIEFDVVATGAGVTEIVNDFRLMMGDEEVGTLTRVDTDSDIGGETFASSTDGTIAIKFTDVDEDDVVIEEGEKVSFTLVADINDTDGGFSAGDSLVASLAAADVDAEDENGDAVTDLNGSASSEGTAFYVEGAVIGKGAADTATIKDLTSQAVGGELGVYTIKFDVTAFGDDIYVPTGTTIATSSVSGSSGVVYGIEGDDGVLDMLNAAGLASTTAAVSSSASRSGDYFRVREGKTETFELSVTLTPLADGYFRAQLYGINFNVATAGTADTMQLAVPATDFETSLINLDA
jgi:hypothetical protein